jgi:iron complex transport system substrate-binding protein
MRVISLVPAGTEIVAALGAEDLLVGISHECDYPPSVQHLPRVTGTQVDVRASGAEIDAEVRRLRQAGLPVIAIDEFQLQRLAPDLIITQDLCEVCAVSDGQVHRFRPRLGSPRILSLTAQDLEGIWGDIAELGAALGRADQADELTGSLQRQLQDLGSSGPRLPPRVACIEWLDPLYLAGHWVPELVGAAGGSDVASVAGSHSVRADWSELLRLEPTCVVIMLCGFGIERSRAELELVNHPAALELLARVPAWVLEGNAYTSRPGPRVVQGARLMQAAFRGESAAGVERWQPAAVC